MDYCADHTAHERALTTHDRRLDNHGAQLDKLNETLAALKEIERQNQERIDALDERLTTLESVPAQRWNLVVGYLITTILGMIAGLLTVYIGL